MRTSLIVVTLSAALSGAAMAGDSRDYDDCLKVQQFADACNAGNVPNGAEAQCQKMPRAIQFLARCEQAMESGAMFSSSGQPFPRPQMGQSAPRQNPYVTRRQPARNSDDDDPIMREAHNNDAMIDGFEDQIRALKQRIPQSNPDNDLVMQSHRADTDMVNGLGDNINVLKRCHAGDKAACRNFHDDIMPEMERRDASMDQYIHFEEGRNESAEIGGKVRRQDLERQWGSQARVLHNQAAIARQQGDRYE